MQIKNTQKPNVKEKHLGLRKVRIAGKNRDPKYATEFRILTSLQGCSSPKKMPRMMAGMMINQPPVATKPIHIMSGWLLNTDNHNIGSQWLLNLQPRSNHHHVRVVAEHGQSYNRVAVVVKLTTNHHHVRVVANITMLKGRVNC